MFDPNQTSFGIVARAMKSKLLALKGAGNNQLSAAAL
jgi:hypothetical protein